MVDAGLWLTFLLARQSSAKGERVTSVVGELMGEASAVDTSKGQS